MKVVFTLIIMLMANAMMAQDTLQVYVNKKTVGYFASNEEAKIITLRKTVAANAKSICIQLKVDKINASPYKQTLEITNKKESLNTALNITEKNFAKKDITSLLKKYNFFKGENVKIFLLLNPANTMMQMPSRRIYLGDLIYK